VTSVPKSDFGPCRICRAPLRQTVVDLGMQPLADDFPTPVEAGGEPSFPLHVLVCGTCWLVQLSHFEGAEEILAEHTHASSSYSDTLLAHVSAWTDELIERFGLTGRHLVVEAECNDGYLLRNFVDRGVGALGLDHVAGNVEAARNLGVPAEHGLLNLATARRLAADRPADLLVGNHNLANSNDLGATAAAMRAVLAPSGRIALEFHHVLSVVQGDQFDVVSHSHCCYLSLLALQRALEDNGLVLVDAEQVDVHGGSVRAYAAHADERALVEPGVKAVLEAERAAGLDTPDAYRGFGARVDRVRDELLGFLHRVHAEGRSIVAYGAPAKGNTLLNSCQVSTDLLPWTVDRSPAKHGRVLPGSHLPIFSPEHILEAKPDYVLILPWSLAGEITRQLAAVRSWGGQFVTAMPRVEVLP
jgi:SAM-dependent methyltransferase